MSAEGEKPLEGAEAMEAVVSPLAGVNPRSLDALMSEDVAKLQEPEFDQVIDAMRKMRQAYVESEARKDEAKATAPPGARSSGPKTPKASKGTVNINLDELL